ncbi:Antirestriction protein [Escherichia coli]|nr:Antirestriction protein [Escherichia coli]
MKTLSQNTTSSACAPETGLQQLVATIVPDEQRISFYRSILASFHSG